MRRSIRKKLTVTVDGEVYSGLYQTAGLRKIIKFIKDMIRPHVVRTDLESACAEMAVDQSREQEAMEWAELTFKNALT